MGIKQQSAQIVIYVRACTRNRVCNCTRNIQPASYSLQVSSFLMQPLIRFIHILLHCPLVETQHSAPPMVPKKAPPTAAKMKLQNFLLLPRKNLQHVLKDRQEKAYFFTGCAPHSPSFFQLCSMHCAYLMTSPVDNSARSFRIVSFEKKKH